MASQAPRKPIPYILPSGPRTVGLPCARKTAGFIADRVSERIGSILQKLEAVSRVDAAVRAVRMGLE